LFDGGLRGWLHRGRFQWLRRAIRDADVSSVFELGCFDAKTLDYLPREPKRYVGVDADWEGGLSAAREAWPRYEFIRCASPQDLDSVSGSFSCSICMDTFEHIPVELIDGYVDQLARLTRNQLFITVPVEKGPVFLGKYLSKRLVGSLSENDADIGAYTAAEVLYATLGRCEKVRRGEHKGFDYAWLAARIRRRFEIVTWEGYPFARLPKLTNFGVCMIAEPR
jgi:hypothetical protein